MSGTAAAVAKPPAAITVTQRPCTPSPPGFEAFLTLFTRGTADEPAERLYAVLQEALSAYPERFTARCTLRGVPQAVQLCCDRVSAGDTEFTAVLTTFLVRLAAPLHLADVRDARRQQQAVAAALDAASEALLVQDTDVQHHAAAALSAMIEDMRDKGWDDLNPPPPVMLRKRDTRFKALDDSDAVVRLLRFVASGTATPRAGLLCLSALRGASCYRSVALCMVDASAVDILLCLLARLLHSSDAPLQDERTSAALETVWNLLDLLPDHRASLGAPRHLETLLTYFQLFLSQGHRLKDKELRNDLLSIVTLAAGDPDTHPTYLYTGWARVVWLSSCGLELVPDSKEYKSGNKPFTATTAQDDYDMKRQLWHLMYLLSFNEGCLRFFLSKGVISVLLSYINSRCSNPAVIRWPAMQLLGLQKQALYVLAQFAHGAVTELREAGAGSILLTFVAECTDVGLRDAALNAVASVAATANKALLAEASAVPSIVQLSNAAIELSVKRSCLDILSSIIGGNPELQRQFSQAGGVDMLLQFLGSDLPPTTFEVRHLLFTVVDCVWCCIIGCPESEYEFIQNEGVHALLDLLVTAPMWIKVSVLSCLEDFMTSNRSAVDEVLEWKSDAGESVPQVLIKIWNEDDAKAGSGSETSTRDFEVQGAVSVDDHKQNTWSSADLLLATTGRLQCRPEAVLESFKCDVKMKIYCIFSKAFPAGSSVLRALTETEKAQLQLIVAYASLKRDQVWLNIEDSLRKEETKPIGLDRVRLQRAKEEAAERGEEIRQKQQSLQKVNTERVQAEEASFYKLMIKATDDTARTKTGNVGLSITEAKIRKAQMLKQSFLSAVPVGAATCTTPTAGGSPAKKQLSGYKGPPAAVSPAQKQPTDATKLVTDFRALEEATTSLIMKVRADPSFLLKPLQDRLDSTQADGTLQLPGTPAEMTVEGAAGFKQAMDFIKASKDVSLPPLRAAQGLALAARDHALDQSVQSQVSHVGKTSSTPLHRMNRYGLVVGRHAESICLGKKDALDIVCNLVVNDGVNSKVDRLNLFNADFQVFGVACTSHPLHKFLCIIEYAASYQNASQKP